MNPFAFLVICVAGWMNRNQQDVIEYLQEEIRFLTGQGNHRQCIENGGNGAGA